jgi:hypothetical protein
VKKLVVLSAGAIAVASAALLAPGPASAEPSAATLNVVGEPYGRAQAILKSQGVKVMFGGATSGKVPQMQCIVYQQTVLSGGKMRLMLDCSEKAVQEAAEAMPVPASPATGGAPGGPAPGAGQGTYGGPIGVPVPVG